MISLHRNSSIKDFLVQEYYGSSNSFPSWLIVTIVFCLTFSVLVSQYVPIVPKFVSDIQLLGYHLNKFGFTFTVIIVFYLLKAFLGYVFYQSTGDAKKWAVFYFTNSRFYFIASLALIILNIIHYYFPIDKGVAFPYYLLLIAIVFIFKIFYYLFHKNQVLPKEWYYKILYICTLQIGPLFALWKLLFF